MRFAPLSVYPGKQPYITVSKVLPVVELTVPLPGATRMGQALAEIVTTDIQTVIKKRRQMAPICMCMIVKLAELGVQRALLLLCWTGMCGNE